MAKHEVFHTPATDTSVGKDGTRPSGHVITDGKVSGEALPERTTGSDSIPEVTYDCNDVPVGVHKG